MANVISVKVPLEESQNSVESYNTTLVDTARQNMKMILLTNPGERIMLSDFGVGFRRMLFEQNNERLASMLQNSIYEQMAKYAAGIRIDGIDIVTDPNSTIVGVSITFSIVSARIFNQQFIFTNS
jgi:phage baseplate assembly protein W